MSGLSQDQEAMRAAIRKKAMIYGAVFGLIGAGLLWWMLGSQGMPIRAGAALLGGVAVGFATVNKSMKSSASSALCPACNAAFSISRSNRKETVTASQNMDKREEQDDGSVKLTTWVEDKIDVVETYTCASCKDATTKEFQITRKRDEETTVEAKLGSNKAGKSDKGGKSDRAKPDSGKKTGSASKSAAKKK